ncbi:hypothetical protein [Tenacibaculum piscium]|uniref:Uncharacterized protein n=1 Tax=Tenacibaculum piscium TaxID=1458515 RepID=A0A2H1YGZ5_9FLAO|nr:hypothetical protein [Tenacibaculum piscium]MBE7628441.1 hypothetical protein [Tenacibaculum piscium]SOS74766.1 hypothetical protein TNO020_30009 [Tenacibaculum piscium]
MSNQEELLKELIEKQTKAFDLIEQLNQNQTKAFNTIDENFENLNTRVSSIEKKLSSLANDTNKGFDDVKIELEKISKVTSYPEQYRNTEGLA